MERPHQMVIAHDRPDCRNSQGPIGIATAEIAVTMQGIRPGLDLRGRRIPFFISCDAAGLVPSRVRHDGRALAGFRLGDGKKGKKKQQIRNVRTMQSRVPESEFSKKIPQCGISYQDNCLPPSGLPSSNLVARQFDCLSGKGCYSFSNTVAPTRSPSWDSIPSPPSTCR